MRKIEMTRTPADEACAEEMRGLLLLGVEKALGRLAARDQELLHLTFNEKHSQEMIATRFGVRPDSVRRLVHRALSRLRAQLRRDPTIRSAAA